jgi:hypothetical protein
MLGRWQERLHAATARLRELGEQRFGAGSLADIRDAAVRKR